MVLCTVEEYMNTGIPGFETVVTPRIITLSDLLRVIAVLLFPTLLGSAGLEVLLSTRGACFLKGTQEEH